MGGTVKFLVTVTCALHIKCGLPGEYSTTITASNSRNCHQMADDALNGFGKSPKDFVVTCRRK